MRSISAGLLLFALLILAAPALAAADQAAIQNGTFDSDGVKIAYIVAGEGTPVVLIHGLYSSAEMNWQLPGTFRLLAQHHRVIALDLRGHGNSDKPTEDAAYGKPMVEDITRLMDHLHIEKAHIVGYSLGGIIAMRFIVDHPDRVISGALGGMGWLREGGALQGVWENLPARGGANNKTPPACIHGIARLAISEKELKAINLPMEILIGDRDPCRKLYVEPLQAVRKDWPIIEIHDAGHINCIFKEQFKSELAKWVDNN
jgi:pimeloyl-ACP methyl ester carboxylesterase